MMKKVEEKTKTHFICLTQLMANSVKINANYRARNGKVVAGQGRGKGGGGACCCAIGSPLVTTQQCLVTTHFLAINSEKPRNAAAHVAYA